jgi:hypothetical protein
MLQRIEEFFERRGRKGFAESAEGGEKEDKVLRRYKEWKNSK